MIKVKNGRYVDEYGIVSWYKDGEKHREDGPAVEWSDGDREWWLNGKRHREDGPAIEWTDGTKEWWLNGKRHRLDGPAIEWTDGNKEWFINYFQYTEEEFNQCNQWLEKKKLNEKFQATLQPKPTQKRSKI